MSSLEYKCQIDQKVVDPSQGVGKITNITEKKFKDQMINYYVIYLAVSDMVVMVPVDKVDELGIRAIVSAEEAQKAIDMMAEEVEPITSDWKLRYQMNLDLLKKGSVLDIATIVRCLYHRSKVKELPILERKLYDSAKKLLEDEISFALDMNPKEVEAILLSKLEPLGLVRDAKNSSISSSFDDEDEYIDEDDDSIIPDDDEDYDDDDGDGDEE